MLVRGRPTRRNGAELVVFAIAGEGARPCEPSACVASIWLDGVSPRLTPDSLLVGRDSVEPWVGFGPGLLHPKHSGRAARKSHCRMFIFGVRQLLDRIIAYKFAKPL